MAATASPISPTAVLPEHSRRQVVIHHRVSTSTFGAGGIGLVIIGFIWVALITAGWDSSGALNECASAHRPVPASRFHCQIAAGTMQFSVRWTASSGAFMWAARRVQFLQQPAQSASFSKRRAVCIVFGLERKNGNIIGTPNLRQ